MHDCTTHAVGARDQTLSRKNSKISRASLSSPLQPSHETYHSTLYSILLATQLEHSYTTVTLCTVLIEPTPPDTMSTPHSATATPSPTITPLHRPEASATVIQQHAPLGTVNRESRWCHSPSCSRYIPFFVGRGAPSVVLEKC